MLAKKCNRNNRNRKIRIEQREWGKEIATGLLTPL